MLIASPRPTREDLRLWAERDESDARYLASGGVRAIGGKADEATRVITAFRSAGPCYLGVSWGKDSTVIAHLVAASGLDIPMVRVRCEPLENPDCDLVRDAFLARYPSVRYHEAVVWCRRDLDGWHATGTLEAGLLKARELARCSRYLSGIRAAESGLRKMRVLFHGLATAGTCAPIGHWSGIDVFGYLRLHDLPVHPAYACSMLGAVPRERLRVTFLSLEFGASHGGKEWERRYYGDALRAIDAMTAPPPGVDVVPEPNRERGSWRAPR